MYLTTLDPISRDFDRIVRRAFGGAVSHGGSGYAPALPMDTVRRDGTSKGLVTPAQTAWLQQQLQPKGVGVVLEAEHLCMSLRGVQKPGAKTVTSALHGLVRDDPRTREEFLSLTGWRTR